MSEMTMRPETDEELYVRIANAYGMWGAFLGHAMECRGAALDECAAHVKLKREQLPAKLAAAPERTLDATPQGKSE